ILVMAGVMQGEHAALAEFRLTPVVHSLEELPLFRGPIHLKLDTGLNRLGTLAGAEEIAFALRAAPHIHLEGLLSHFASAANFATQHTEDQIRLFESHLSALATLRVHATYRHISSTNAIAYPRAGITQTLVRPGHAIYGYVSPSRSPAHHAKFRVQPALKWK